MLATAVLLATCVHDTDDHTLFIAESGASLAYYIGGSAKAKGGHDDPWNRIQEIMLGDPFSEGKNGDDDPWNTIGGGLSLGAVHSWKETGRSFRGKPVVEMLLVLVGAEKREDDDPWSRIGDLFPMKKHGGMLLRLDEVRGQVGRFSFVSGSDGGLLDGPSVFAVGVPLGWESGLVLRGEAYLLDTKKMLPLVPRSGSASSGSPEVLGAVVWEVDRALSPGPFRCAASTGTTSCSFRGPRERGDMADLINSTVNDVDYD